MIPFVFTECYEQIVKNGFDLATQLVKFLSKHEQLSKLDIQVEYEPPFFRADQSTIYLDHLILKDHDRKEQDTTSGGSDDPYLRSRYKISKFGNLVFGKDLKRLKEKVESNAVCKDVKLT